MTDCTPWLRRYEPFVVAEVDLSMPRVDTQPQPDAAPSVSNGRQPKGRTDSSASDRSSSGGGAESSVSPAAGGGGAFNALAGYIFGGNAARERMAMTTPVFTESRGSMQFVVRTSDDVRLRADCSD